MGLGASMCSRTELDADYEPRATCARNPLDWPSPASAGSLQFVDHDPWIRSAMADPLLFVGETRGFTLHDTRLCPCRVFLSSGSIRVPGSVTPKPGGSSEGEGR